MGRTGERVVYYDAGVLIAVLGRNARAMDHSVRDPR